MGEFCLVGLDLQEGLPVLLWISSLKEFLSALPLKTVESKFSI